MEEQNTVGQQRNKEKSKQKFLDAVGIIINTKGFAGLKVNDIARTAGLDKKLMYAYFGSRDGLIDAYIRSQDFWINVKDEKMATPVTDGGKELTKAMLHSQFDYVFKNKNLQKILLWGLIENRKSLKKLAQDREDYGAMLFESISDPHFGENAERYRAVTALLVAGIYYLDIYACTHEETFCGLNMKDNSDREKINEALSFLIDKTYEG